MITNKLLALTVPGQGQISAPPNIPSGVSLGGLITAFLGIFITFGVLISIVFIAYGAILWITSGGDKTKVDKARKTLMYSVIGVIVIALSFVIINAITAVLGVVTPVAK